MPVLVKRLAEALSLALLLLLLFHAPIFVLCFSWREVKKAAYVLLTRAIRSLSNELWTLLMGGEYFGDWA